MRITGPSSEAEMIAEFLRAEIDSDRWSGWIRDWLDRHSLPEALVRSPDSTDPGQNATRSALLGEFRGWAAGAMLFRDFPGDVIWHRADLDPADVGDVLGASYRDWTRLSGGTRRVGDAADNVLGCRFPIETDVVTAVARALVIRDRYAAGHVLRLPILVTDGAKIVAIEGHTRLLGWQLGGPSKPLAVILGRSASIASWYFWVDHPV
jgi:hypothetical protein